MQPAIVRTIERHIVVKPATRQVVVHPTVIATERQKVLVWRSGYAWRRD